MDNAVDVTAAHGADWQRWLFENAQRGCSAVSMFERMVGQSVWQPDQARQALSQTFAAAGREVPSFGALLQRPTLPAEQTIALDDCRPRILARFTRPEAALVQDLLSLVECAALIAQAVAKGLQPSGVVDGHTGASVRHQARTSTSVFFGRAETPLVAALERRLALLTGWPLSHGEGLQVLRYENGQQYKPHYDWFDPDKPGSAQHLQSGGQRYATTVVYLQAAEDGGATVFPQSGIVLSPPAGGAVFFNDVDVLCRPDPQTLHGGAPVLQGVKIVATYWQRAQPFGQT